jgi:hypothetical protein
MKPTFDMKRPHLNRMAISFVNEYRERLGLTERFQLKRMLKNLKAL